MKPVNIKDSEMNREYSPKQLGLHYTTVERHRIGGTTLFETAKSEHALVILSGKGVVECAGKIFSVGHLDTLYLPWHQSVRIEGEDLTFMRYSAPSDRDVEPTLFEFSSINSDIRFHNTFGSVQDGTGREVWKIINDDFPCSRLMIGICKGMPGCWTAWPPHRHGEAREEVYYYFEMEGNYAVQLVYNNVDDPEMVSIVKDGDLISIPDGFHPNFGTPAQGISYIYCMVATVPGERNFMDLEIQEEYREQFAGDMK
ncbi:MAG: 5-deoxy-glucuronate isomerase [Sphaerochaetaceae bacterium]|nr:5-deoxy-glucuronate isomerase [Sphaerochaetaceae bacterium]